VIVVVVVALVVVLVVVVVVIVVVVVFVVVNFLKYHHGPCLIISPLNLFFGQGNTSAKNNYL